MASPDKIRTIHTMLSQRGISEDEKRTLIGAFTEKRTASTKDMKDNEADRMVKFLNTLPTKNNEADRMRKKIIAMAHQLDWNVWDGMKGKYKADMKRIDDWCLKYGKFHKKLNEHSIKELTMLVTQFQTMYQDQFARINKSATNA